MKLSLVQYLRGLAALCVVFAHAFNLPLAQENLDLVRLGRFGVLMFFVISGFIMVLISGEGRFDPWSFLKRRIIRIVPLYWLATFAVAALTILLPQVFNTTAFTVSHLLLSLLFVPHVAPSGEVVPLLWLGWTLVYEMFFYVCFALLCGVSAARRIGLLTAIFAVLSIVGGTLHPSGAIATTYTNTVILAFCAGGWVGLATLRGRTVGGTPGQALALAAVVIVSATLAWGLDRGERGAGAVSAAMAVASVALLMLAVAWDGRLRRSAALTTIGDASYSIYLSHIYVLGAVGVLCRRIFGAGAYPVTVVAGIAAAIVGGLLVYRLVEQPMLKLLRRRGHAIDPRGPAVSAPSSPRRSRGEEGAPRRPGRDVLGGARSNDGL